MSIRLSVHVPLHISVATYIHRYTEDQLRQKFGLTEPVQVGHMSKHISKHMSKHTSRHRSIHMSRHMSIHMSRHMSMHMSRHMSMHMSWLEPAQVGCECACMDACLNLVLKHTSEHTFELCVKTK